MRILNSKIFTVALLFLMVWVLFSVVSVEIEKDEAKREEKNTQAKINDTNRDNEKLQKFLKNLNDPEFLEKEARFRLNYKEMGEEVVFVYKNDKTKEASVSDNSVLRAVPNYKKWLDWFLSI